jgi:hypothetical protein
MSASNRSREPDNLHARVDGCHPTPSIRLIARLGRPRSTNSDEVRCAGDAVRS